MMLENIDNALRDLAYNIDDKKVIKNEKLEEYLNSYSEDVLLTIIGPYVLLNDNIEGLLDFNMKKKDIINYIKNNIEEIIKSIILISEQQNIDYLKKIINKDGYIKNVGYAKCPLLVAVYLKKYSLAKVHYDKQEDSTELYMPLEFRNTIKKFINDPAVKRENKKFMDSIQYIDNVVSTYGMIPLDKLHEFFCKHMYKISIDELEYLLFKSYLLENPIFYDPDSDDRLIYSGEFESPEEALDFYKKTSGNYKEFTKRELDDLQDDSYIENLDSFKKLKRYIFEEFDMDEDAFELIKHFLILDYIYSAQFSLKAASKNYNSHFGEFLDCDTMERKKIENMIKNIFNEYPKWIKRGNI